MRRALSLPAANAVYTPGMILVLLCCQLNAVSNLDKRSLFDRFDSKYT